MFYSAFIVAGYLVAWLSGKRITFVPAPGLGPILTEVAIGLGTAVTLLIATRLAERLPFARDMEDEFRRILGRLEIGEILLLAIASGLGEEILFRGVLQPVIGYIPASVIFGVIHTGPSRKFVAWTVFALAIGFLFGAIVLWRGSILSVVTAHALVNGVNLHRICRDVEAA